MSRAVSLTIDYPIITVTVQCSVSGIERPGFEQRLVIHPGDAIAAIKTLLNNTLATHGADAIDTSWSFVVGIVNQVQTAAINTAYGTLNPTYAPILTASAGQTL